MAKPRLRRQKEPRSAAHTPAPPVGRHGSSWRRWSILAIAGLVLLAAGFGARALLRGSNGASPVASAGGAGDNLLLITLDTTRADHLGAYGSQRARTRHLDRLAAEGIRFDRAYSPAPITLPAHASILTGLYPFDHGVRNNGNFYLGERFDTLATRLRAKGYRTAAFVSSFILDRRYGLARGFETYDDKMEGAQPQVVEFEAERRGDRTALALHAWLDRYAAGKDAGSTAPWSAGRNAGSTTASGGAGVSPVEQRPFFVWLHLYDPHEPYRPPPPFRDAFLDAPYDGEIAFDDAVIASVLDHLGRLGLDARTIVAVVGDHGESLGDHGEETHSMFVYDPVLRVPMILWRPGLLPGGQVVSEPVRVTDLAPTLLQLLGASPLQTKDGRSLMPVIEGRDRGAPPVIYAETLLPQFYMDWAPLRSIRDDRWKLIDAPTPELYDTATDATESHNRYSERQQTARGLQRALEQLTGGTTGAMATGTMDRETLEKLASLGYVGAGAEPAGTGNAGVKPDPKDMIAVFNRLRQANSAVRDRRFGEALPILREVLAKDPRNAFAQLVLGSAHMGMGDYRAAIAQYQKYLELVPSSAYAHHWLSICFIRLGDQANALREADATLAIDKRFSDARIMRGGILASRGDYPGAVAELKTAVDTDPGKPMIRLDLAKVLAEAGQASAAQAQYEEVLRAQPDYGPALTGYGALLASQGDLGRAEAALQRAIEVEPRDDQARFNLAKVYEQQGKASDAKTEYQRVAGSPTASPAIRSAARKKLGEK